MVSISVSQPVSHRVSSHSHFQVVTAAMLAVVEVCDGGTHLVGRGGKAHRHQDADAREVALAGTRTAGVAPGLDDARDVSAARGRGVSRALRCQQITTALKREVRR